MHLKDLIERGYFPKELPPPFNTTLLADKVTTIRSNWAAIFTLNTDWRDAAFPLASLNGETASDFRARKKELVNKFISKYSSSRATEFSISKGKFSRRYLRIPNPKHYLALCEKIATNWAQFEYIYQLSEFSASYPVPESDINKRSVSTFSKGVADFRNKLLSTSFNKTIEIKVDISKFYPTIYTHSITWAFLGKEEAKRYFKQRDILDSLITSGDTNAALYKLADEIDNAVRACQERQSIGIPIGPDSSHIIAELIACRIDVLLKMEFSSMKFKSCRYYDDYYLYVSSKDEADKILKGIQRILIEFQLEINEGKIKIREFPFSFEDEYANAIHQFSFKETNLDSSLRYYFSLIWGLADKSPSKADTIFKYALRTFEFRTTEITKKSWKIFEALLFKTAIIEPSTLDIVTRILLSYKSYLDALSKERLKELFHIVIENHCPLKHNFEVSWALWLAKSFEIEISEDAANLVINMNDPISTLILLDIAKTMTIVSGSPNWGSIEIEIKDDILFSDQWLLAYEATKKGWLTPADPNLLEDNLYFKLLKDEGVEFYDSSKQLTIYTKKEKKVQNTEGGYCCKKNEIKEPEIYPIKDEPALEQKENNSTELKTIDFIDLMGISEL